MSEKKGVLYGTIIAGLFFVGTLAVYDVKIYQSVTGEDLGFVLSITLGSIAGIMFILHLVRKKHLFHTTERRLAIVYFFLSTFAISLIQLVSV